MFGVWAGRLKLRGLYGVYVERFFQRRPQALNPRPKGIPSALQENSLSTPFFFLLGGGGGVLSFRFPDLFVYEKNCPPFNLGYRET